MTNKELATIITIVKAVQNKTEEPDAIRALYQAAYSAAEKTYRPGSVTQKKLK